MLRRFLFTLVVCMGGATGAIAVPNMVTAARLPMRRQPSRHRPLKRA